MEKVLRVGLAGLGTVGAAVLKSLFQNEKSPFFTNGPKIEVVAVSARDKLKNRDIDLSSCQWFDDPVLLAQRGDLDCIVELIGGADGVAYDVIHTALQSGKHVVTANKALLAKHGLELAQFAEKKGLAFAFEASVAGGIPIIKTLREALTGNRVQRVSGILNGTCNYILSRMELEGLDFNSCLNDAQKLGYAEADPTFDIEGFDSGHKLSILSSLAFGTRIDSEGVAVRGITQITPFDLKIANELGFRVKLLGVSEYLENSLEQRVQLTMIPKNSVLGGVMGVTNAVMVQADMIGELTLVGPGAGGKATASAVLGDLVDVACGRYIPPFGVAIDSLKHAERVSHRIHGGGFYIRLSVPDRPGVASKVTQHMAEMDISLESILQRQGTSSMPNDPTGRSGLAVPLILMTYATTEEAVSKALTIMKDDKLLIEEPFVMRVER